MGQVPNYLIIGDGRVARHFQYYFMLLGLNCTHWHRKLPVQLLEQYIENSTHILVLINDQAIEAFLQIYLMQTRAYRIHFSGSLVSELAYGAHPLMTFSENLYSLTDYQSIPFIVDHDAPPDLLPGLLNQQIRLQKSLKAKYHALCVLSGNFSCLLWQKLFNTFEEEFNIPQSTAYAYLRRQTTNLIDDAKKALTGPLVRSDVLTIEKNLTALHADPFCDVYQSFVSCYQKINSGMTS